MEQLAVTDRDVQQMLAITRKYAVDDGAALPWEVLEDLRQLVPCDFLEASGQDTPNWTFFAEQQVFDEGHAQAGDRGTMASGDDEELYRLFYWDSACSYPDRGDISVAVRESDIETRHEQRNGGFFSEMMRPGGIDHELILALHAGAPQRTLRLLFFRGPGADFSARDVAVLTLLRPHLQAAYLAHERNRQGGPSVLTGRQREILAYVALGYTNRQIARRLELSETTVRKHLENIFARLRVSSRTAAIAKLNDVGLPDMPLQLPSTSADR
jgi:DNA-binding CsgD family transcriptional regulator